MSVRTYNPSVRVGNWNEDIQLEEDMLKDFLEKREKGQLLIQQTNNLGSKLLQEKNLSITRDGLVHFGDVVMLCCGEDADRTKYSSGVDPRDECVLSMNVSDPSKLSQDGGMTCSVSGSKHTKPVLRNVFVIKSVDGTPDGHALTYGQAFHLSTLDEAGNLLLHSDRTSFQSSAKKSRHQAVSLVSEASYLTQWKILYIDPRLRMEFEGANVQANQQMIVAHCKTNQYLAVEQAFLIRTKMGRDYEISCHTYLNSHKAEQDVNKWIIKMGAPGEDIYPVAKETTPLQSATTPEPNETPPCNTQE